MHHVFRPALRLVLVATAFCSFGAAQAQAPALPSPIASDPVVRGTMRGFPPPPDKIVELGTILKFPNPRWAFHHMRELSPTANIWRGAGTASRLPPATRGLDSVSFEDEKGSPLSLTEWQRNTYSDGLLVLHRGKLIYEQTYSGMSLQQPHSLWSMSKSFTGLLVTTLIAEGLIDPNALVSAYLPELQGSAWADATVQQTLDMTTGVQYQENFSDPTSGIFRYLFAAGLLPRPAAYAGPKNIPDFLKTVAKEGEHGSKFKYKTVDTEVLGWLIQRVTGKSYATLLSERIWSRMGAQEDGYVLADSIGTQLASIGMNASMRDLARVGEMMRLNGRANGQQVIPASVVAEIRKGADQEKFKAAGVTQREGYSYHNQWWIPHDADGTFEMKGLHGQHVHVNPAAELVIVKLSSHPIGETIFTHAVDRKAFAAIAATLRRR